MISQPFRRVAGVLAVGVIALGLSSCSSSSTNDAATITYHDSSGEQTIHITRSDFTTQLGELVGSEQFQSLLKGGSIDLAGDQENTTGANVAALYLSLLVEQSAWDAEFASLGLKTSAADVTNAEQAARSQFGLNDRVHPTRKGRGRARGSCSTRSRRRCRTS